MRCGAVSHWQLSTPLRTPTSWCSPGALNEEESGQGPEEAGPPGGSPAPSWKPHPIRTQTERNRPGDGDLMTSPVWELHLFIYLFIVEV